MKDKKGLTLLELLIVIGIIAVLGGVMLTQFSGSTDSALAAACMNNMRTLCNAVLADASKEGYYPSAGSYQYLEENSTARSWWHGWIGGDKGDNPVSCYHADGGDGCDDDQQYAITHGSIWKAITGQRSAYICPAHTKYCKQNSKKVNGLMPSWSYAMNSYFGWNLRTAADITGGRRSYGSGSLTFMYSTSPKDRKRPVERVLLFGEIPYVETGVQTPEWSAGAGEENDSILQYTPSGDENQKANKGATGNGEIIGFNHKTGNDYSAHVAFADGHCSKIVMPRGATEDNLKELTTWLCTGAEYTLSGGKFEVVSE